MTLDIDESETVLNLKYAIEESGQAGDLNVSCMRLFEGSSELEDANPLCSYYTNGSIRSLHLVLRIRRLVPFPCVKFGSPELITQGGLDTLHVPLELPPGAHVVAEVCSVCDQNVDGVSMWNLEAKSLAFTPSAPFKPETRHVLILAIESEHSLLGSSCPEHADFVWEFDTAPSRPCRLLVRKRSDSTSTKMVHKSN
jgi:hypothetical protein